MKKLFKIEHGHILRYFDFLHVAETKAEPGFDVLVMDYIEGGNFAGLQNRETSEENKRRVAEGMVGAIGALHQAGVFHGNLKEGNILLQDIGHLHVRLSDYGFIDKQEYERTGTQYPLEAIKYLAPEQIEPENFARRGKIQQNVDFWALGLLIYELFTGKYAFGEVEGTSSNLMTRILHADLPSDIDRLPAPYADLVRACLVRNAEERPRKVEQLRKILDGGYEWRKGKARRKPKAAVALPPPIRPKPPEPVKCSSCGKVNKPKTSICEYCGRAMSGPTFLRNFRRNGNIGFWAIAFLTFLFIPIGFLYKEFHERCPQVGANACDFVEWFQSIAEKNSQQETVGATIAVLALLTFTMLLSGIFFLVWFGRASRNLTALGSAGQSYKSWFLTICFLIVLTGLVVLVLQPIAGLVLILLGLILPLNIFQEVWKGSNPNFLEQGQSWKKTRSSFMIFSWWLGTLLMPVIIVLPFLPISLEGINYKEWFTFTIALSVAYWFLCIMVVMRINQRQLSKFKALARSAAN